jgi:hypothetical protein
MGTGADRLADHTRENIRGVLTGVVADPIPDVARILHARRQSQLEMLRAIRAGCPATRLNLRIATDPWFYGGKSTLAFSDIEGLADSVTLTFFGQPVNADAIPEHPPVPLHAGFVFHSPDCMSAADVRERYRLLRSRGPEQINFYSFSMASSRHFDWLRETLQGTTS